MRLRLLFLAFSLLHTISWAQPANDDCSGAISLSVSPACADRFFSNLGATAGAGAIPTCFNGGNVQRDVWFSFRTQEQMTAVTIFLNGRPDGPNNQPLLNPQIALYRGACGGLSELACASAVVGSAQVRLNAANLTPNTLYYLRINDFTASATPNAGDFTVCVQEQTPDYLMGQTPRVNTCFGTLFDSGGPNGPYRPQERNTFTICPSQPAACIELDVVSFDIEDDDLAIFLGQDRLNFYAGPSTGSPKIASAYGKSNGRPFVVQAASSCVTVEFVSDFVQEQAGFEIRWQCSALPCDGSLYQPTPITSLPFEARRLSTCTGKATVGTSDCAQDNFLAGSDYVFTYESNGRSCLEIELSNADPGTGIAVFNGPPNSSSSECVVAKGNGRIPSAAVDEPGTYYIVVSKAGNCTNFDISVRETSCALEPSLANALRRPFNGCQEADGLPSTFFFQDGFQDIELRKDVNSGCWLNVGQEANFYWFSVQARIMGALGFILASADQPSDIDFNVWGPFTEEQIVGQPQEVIQFIRTNQPIRSSWSPGPEATGMVPISPLTGRPVTDAYDCEQDPGATGDDYVTLISTQPGEVYVILVNDWGNEIVNGGISVDWSPSTLGLLDPVDPEIIAGDTAICLGDSARIQINIGTNTIRWISGAESLSCTDCPNPVARPQATTTYLAVVESPCLQDTLEVTVQVLRLSAGQDQQVCLGQRIQIFAGEDYENATYAWSATPATGLSFSCRDCPNPLITANQAGTFTVRVTLRADNGRCQLTDEMQLLVTNEPAPRYRIPDRDIDICEGESIRIGIDSAEANLNYQWFTTPGTVLGTEATLDVNPNSSTTYYVLIRNASCSEPPIDSVVVNVFRRPLLNVHADTLLCIGDTIQLGQGPKERDVLYAWDGPEEILDRSDPRSRAVPQNSGTYTLTAVRGACEVQASFSVNVNTVDVSIPQGDTLFFCSGDERDILAAVRKPLDLQITPVWTSSDPTFGTVNAESIRVRPADTTLYRVQISYLNCVQTDSVLVLVDSLPASLEIMPADTSICEGQFVVLRTPAYETKDYPNIEFQWLPSIGQQSPDSLLNMVVTPDTTTTYYRITTNGGCRDSTAATIEVKPIPELRVVPADTALCFGERVRLSLVGPAGLEEIMWSPPDGLSCSDCPNPTATAFSSTTYEVQAELDGCPGNASARIEVISPIFNLTDQTLICRGTSVRLNNVFTPGATYTWTADDPTFGTVVDPRPVVTPTRTTTYTLRITSADCDPFEVRVTIRVVDPPTIQASAADSTICLGEGAVLRAQVNGGISEDRFAWFIEGNPDTLSRDLEVRVFPRNRVNNYVFVYNSPCGTFRQTVRVFAQPEPVFDLTDRRIICLGESVRLNEVADPNASYVWTADDPAFGTVTVAQPLVSPTRTTTYSVVIDNGSCPPVRQQVRIEVIGQVTVQAAAQPASICSGESTLLRAVVTGGSSQDDFTWTASNGQTFKGTEVRVQPQQTTTYFFTYTSAAGCQTINRTVTVQVSQGINSVNISANPPGQVPEGSPVVLTADIQTNNSGLLDIEWSENGAVIPDSINPVITVRPIQGPDGSSSTYTIIVTTPEGCADTASISIPVVASVVVVPNAFTPNGDGKNDFFNLLSSGAIGEITRFQVYNRWGQVVYDNIGGPGWDGTFNGQPQPSDVYVYIITYRTVSGVERTEKGDVTLIR